MITRHFLKASRNKTWTLGRRRGAEGEAWPAQQLMESRAAGEEEEEG